MKVAWGQWDGREETLSRILINVTDWGNESFVGRVGSMRLNL